MKGSVTFHETPPLNIPGFKILWVIYFAFTYSREMNVSAPYCTKHSLQSINIIHRVSTDVKHFRQVSHFPPHARLNALVTRLPTKHTAWRLTPLDFCMLSPVVLWVISLSALQPAYSPNSRGRSQTSERPRVDLKRFQNRGSSQLRNRNPAQKEIIIKNVWNAFYLKTVRQKSPFKQQRRQNRGRFGFSTR